MARFAGDIGYGESVESPPDSGVWKDVITKRKYFRDITRTARELQEGDHLNKDISVSNTISIVADAYAFEHFFAIRYVVWSGVNWTVTSVEVQRPRLLLRLGGVYNGPTAP